jgi:hypothetical protein
MKGAQVKAVLIIFEILTLGIMMAPLPVDRWFYQGDESIMYGSLTQINYDSEILPEGKDYCEDDNIESECLEDFDNLKANYNTFE